MAEGNLTLKEFWKLSAKERCERYKDLSERDRLGVRQADSGAISVPCNRCMHYLGYAKCEAFPDGIDAGHIDAISNNITADCGSGYCFKEK